VKNFFSQSGPHHGKSWKKDKGKSQPGPKAGRGKIDDMKNLKGRRKPRSSAGWGVRHGVDDGGDGVMDSRVEKAGRRSGSKEVSLSWGGG